MIDIHTHILPGVDDGPRTPEESIEMLKWASGAGIEKIVATPHVLEIPSKEDWQRIKDSFVCLKQEIVREKIDIDVILGAELLISPDLPQAVKKNKGLTINSQNRHVLLELPMGEIPVFTEKTIFELVVQGITPIIAHPERYLAFQKDNNKLADFIKKGVLTQGNAGSLMGRYGKKVQKTAKALLSNNLIHMIGSDVHSISGGAYLLILGVNLAGEIEGREKANAMASLVPEKVINGEAVEILPPRVPERCFLKKIFSSNKAIL